MIYFSTVLLFVIALFSFRRMSIQHFKISYYEAKLKSRGVDISHIEKIKSLKEIREL
jgi:hypothetical protein